MRNFYCDEIDCEMDCRFCELNRDFEKILENYQESIQTERLYNDKFSY